VELQAFRGPLSAQGTYLSSSLLRFIFGVNAELKNNAHFLEDHRIVYAAGHNVIVYNTEDKSQYFYQGKLNS
jgi:hypothetical protein